MLSEENISKLVKGGIYQAEPMLNLLPSYKMSDPYWCKNWTFRWHRGDDDSYYMVDTYWSTGSLFSIELTDENFDKFHLLFKDTEVEKMPNGEQYFYEWNEHDRWRVAIDSGGWSYPKYFIRKGARKNKAAVIERLEQEIKSLESKLNYKKNDLNKVLNDEINLNYV